MSQADGPPAAPSGSGCGTGAAGATVAVLMATRNGAKFLDEQLTSIHEQNHLLIDIWASDDGSTDETRAKLSAWQKRWSKGRFTVLGGPCKGFAENFRSLICNRTIEAGCFALSDQDDIWESDKLSRAVAWIQTAPGRPRLFCSRTSTMSESGVIIGASPLFGRPPAFRNALVQSIAGGNTMVMDPTARSILVDACERTAFLSHDWWAYLVLSGAGADIHYDPTPLVRYRQHGQNEFGQNATIRARVDRMRRLFAGQFLHWTSQNLDSLDKIHDILTEDAKRTLELFHRSRRGSLSERLVAFWKSGVYRQSAAGTAALAFAALAGRF